jgi:DNA polymerase-1
MFDSVVIDTSLLCYRNWYPVRELVSSDGIHTGLEYGLIKGILAITRIWQPAEVIMAWDGFPKRCNDIFPKRIENGQEVGYKSGRQKHVDKETEAPWSPRIEELKKVFLPAVKALYHPETEADEQIARYTYQQTRMGKKTLIISKDRDFHQMISSQVSLVLGDEDQLITPKEVEDKWGLTPDKVIYRRAMEGDSGDAIKGIPRFPKDIIIALASKAESLDHLIDLGKTGGFCKNAKQLQKFIDHEGVVRRNYALSELSTQANYDPNFVEGYTGDITQLRDMCHRLEFRSLLDRKEWSILSKNRD